MDKIDAKSCAVVCTSESTLRKIQDDVKETFNASLTAESLMENDDKQRIIDRFAEIFESTLLANIVTNGRPLGSSSSDVEETTEMAAFDAGLRDLENEVTQQVDSEIVVVAKKRKHGPHHTMVQLATTCRHQITHLRKASVDHEAENVDVDAVENPLVDCAEEQQVSDMGADVVNGIKAVPGLVSAAVNVEQAQHMQRDFTTATDRRIFNMHSTTGL